NTGAIGSSVTSNEYKANTSGHPGWLTVTPTDLLPEVELHERVGFDTLLSGENPLKHVPVPSSELYAHHEKVSSPTGKPPVTIASYCIFVAPRQTSPSGSAVIARLVIAGFRIY